jgi:hypothetical protein
MLERGVVTPSSHRRSSPPSVAMRPRVARETLIQFHWAVRLRRDTTRFGGRVAANGSSFPPGRPVREAGARTDSASSPRRAHRHLPLRCSRALRRVRREAALRGRRNGRRFLLACCYQEVAKAPELPARGTALSASVPDFFHWRYQREILIRLTFNSRATVAQPARRSRCSCTSRKRGINKVRLTARGWPTGSARDRLVTAVKQELNRGSEIANIALRRTF